MNRMAYKIERVLALTVAALWLIAATSAYAQIGRRFPSEKVVVPDAVTGVPLTFLTSAPGGNSKIYQTHRQWTSDGKWLIFHSHYAPGQAMAVNEETGVMVQVTELGHSSNLCLAEHSMNLYFFRNQAPPAPPAANSAASTEAASGSGDPAPITNVAQMIKVDLAKLFADSEAGTLGGATAYETVCGVVPIEMEATGLAIDPTEEFAYFRVGQKESAKHLPADVKPEGGKFFGPTGLAKMNLKSGEVKFIVAVPFHVGHVQANRWVPGEIVFCWETGGDAPERMWTVQSDGSGLRPVYPEAPFEWVTHEVVITRDEVAFATVANQKPGSFRNTRSGPARVGSPEHPTGVGIVNLRTGQMRMVGQVPIGDPGLTVWHVNGSPDGRWAVYDDYQYRLWIIDRQSGEMALLADLGHVTSAANHVHPSFNDDSTKIQVQAATISEDGRSLNICIVPVPKSWLERTYPKRLVP